MTTSYSNEQYELSYPDGIEFHWWNRYRSGFIARLCHDLVPARAGLLEVGCGRGEVVGALRTHGLDVRGVELAPASPLATVTDYVISGQDATTLPQAQRQGVVCILLLDVIEHLPDPVAFLVSLQQAYPDLESVIVTVPARQELWSDYDVFFGHYRRYTLSMLDELEETLGWKQARGGYFFRLPYVVMRLLRSLGVPRSTAMVAPAAGLRWLHALVAAYLRLERWVLPATVPGTSAYAVFRIGR